MRNPSRGSIVVLRLGGVKAARPGAVAVPPISRSILLAQKQVLQQIPLTKALQKTNLLLGNMDEDTFWLTL